MKRTVPIWVAAALAAVSLVVGFVGAGMLARRHTKDLTLARELEIVGLCSGGLRLSAEGSDAKLRRILEGRMDSAVLRSSRLVEEGARLRGPSPNPVESARRAAAHYEAAGNGSMREAADRVILALSPAREAEGATSGGR